MCCPAVLNCYDYENNFKALPEVKKNKKKKGGCLFFSSLYQNPKITQIHSKTTLCISSIIFLSLSFQLIVV